MPDAIPLARPDLGPREEELVIEVLRSGRLSLGDRLDDFEHAFASWVGSDDAVAVSSGTAALHLGVRALGWSDGDEVITSPFSFVASANCLLYEGATPVFCDIDPVTLNLDPSAAQSAADNRPVAGILPVHIFGYPADLIGLESIADAYEIPILEDACQALGAVDAEGRAVGTAGHLAAYAFYANKQMTTGEGGVLIPTDDAAERIRSERNQGRSPDMDEIDHVRIGFNYRITDIQAAIGIAQVERLDELLEARSRVAAGYRERLGALGGAPAGQGDEHGLVLPCDDRGDERRSWFVYPVQLPRDADRAATIARLAEEGIASKAYLPCIHTMPPYRERFGFKGGEFPVAERVAARSLALPFFGSLGEDELDRVCTALGRALGSSS